ncbi:hypothetical protein LZZ85_27160 [Terrimonas sp. NA20]|uniref:Uncharacterized protein n=1 Tax=Terrimonas ginsenosidimutans TaxID=2908004 RepID=A0ABS9L094_9BACT|nr:DUF6620 family protein [Terrimonas ginsenosidimutans]MCG2618012.1 hypothetical protein [Terrimonas ginsenosidimutans]
MSNPLLEPIHGVSLYDYAAISAKMASGIDVKEICKKLGIEPAVFEEASALWVTRMQEDGTWEVTTQFGQYFGDAENHPKLKDLQPEVSDEGKDNLQKMTTDRYFYEELNGARQAAYEYGYDGAQWIQDNFGISLGDFQGVAMKWMQVQNQEMSGGNYENIQHYVDHQQKKQQEYAAKFAAEQGGNVADDVEF